MASTKENSVEDFLLNNDQLETMKRYCKIDGDYDIDVLKAIILSSADEIAAAIDETMTAEEFMNNEELKGRFFVALMKYTEEEYENRGTGSDIMRFPSANQSINNIINQIRAKLYKDAT